jgi:hypothetical protein
MANTVKYANNVKLRSIDLPHQDARDVELDDPTLLLNTSTNPLVDGEWITVETTGEDPSYKYVRCTNVEGQVYTLEKCKLVLNNAHRAEYAVPDPNAGDLDLMVKARKATVYWGNKANLTFDTNVCDVPEGGWKRGDPVAVGEVTVNDPVAADQTKSGLVNSATGRIGQVEEVLSDGWIKVRLDA